MKGSTPERFEVEVLGILPNTLGRTRILVNVSGLGLEKTGVIAGMSGSPVYLEGKLAGALSATWAFGKDPIGQVTPIENMLDIDAAPAAPRARATGVVRGRLGRPRRVPRRCPPEERVLALEKIAAPYRPSGRETRLPARSRRDGDSRPRRSRASRRTSGGSGCPRRFSPPRAAPPGRACGRGGTAPAKLVERRARSPPSSSTGTSSSARRAP